MTVNGVHLILYSSKPESLRETLRDVFGWKHVDARDGWLIFAVPPTELGVHPADGPSHQISLMCDNLLTTMDELKKRGIEFGTPVEAGFGTTVTMVLPGDVEMQLYQPRHATAIDL